MQELLDAQDQVRREAGEALLKTATNKPQEIEPRIPELLGIIKESTDDMVIMQIAHACMLVWVVFNYDPQTAEWACLMCKPPGGNQ